MLPDEDLPLLCRLILPSICEFDAFGPPPYSLAKLHAFRMNNADRLSVFDINISYILSLAGVPVPQSSNRCEVINDDVNEAAFSLSSTNAPTSPISLDEQTNLLGRLLNLAVSPIEDKFGLSILPRRLDVSTSIRKPFCEPGEFWTRYIAARLVLLEGRSSQHDADSDTNDTDILTSTNSGNLAQDAILAVRSRMTIFQFLSHVKAFFP